MVCGAVGRFFAVAKRSPAHKTTTGPIDATSDRGLRGAYHKILSRQVRGASTTEASPQQVFGETAPERFTIRENGVQFELSFNEGYSVGLFLDQRDNRRRLLTGHIAADFPLARTRNTQHATRNF